ncbi:hypothetical protein CH54_122 [Yersinia rochesterensis]|uniref:Uncharacterized protein n=1 Tax=Yersinia rochesterensis TaxID=1604335 RepID=A0ABN4FTU7_9GAMM|nr:hypothetical protein DJ57_977 [Yersinia rochesterensis]AJI88057.1 hypothetical protein AW19_1541 [Yersinia frederiksenii Y225]AJJ36410.1 hypothetical protein CH54_122 [Yersinia rochesterensis]CNG76194.1 Uncharacterised protein [Yersinia kristensenii]CRY60620.1 Uncharacterised protein [Yersinia kristensenii]
MLLDKILLVVIMILFSLFAWLFFSPYHMYSTAYELFELFGFQEGYNNLNFSSPQEVSN